MIKALKIDKYRTQNLNQVLVATIIHTLYAGNYYLIVHTLILKLKKNQGRIKILFVHLKN